LTDNDINFVQQFRAPYAAERARRLSIYQQVTRRLTADSAGWTIGAVTHTHTHSPMLTTTPLAIA